MALTDWDPDDVKVSEQLLAGSVTMHEVDAPGELTVTVPVGVPAPGATGATATVTVAGCPTVAGDGFTELIVVVVIAAAMFQEPFTDVMA